MSLLLNVGLNTNAMRGSSLDITARVSTNPYLDLLYSYNGRRFATFNARVNLSYKEALTVMELDRNTAVFSYLLTNQEVFFSNMHWSSFDMKVGLRNQFYYTFNDLTHGGALNGTVDIPSFFLEGRVETLDDGYFPSKGVSAGFNGGVYYTGFDPDNAQKVMGVVDFDTRVPASFGRFAPYLERA